MLITSRRAIGVLTSYLRYSEKTFRFSGIRRVCQHNTKKNKTSDSRMSPNVFRQQKSYTAIVKNIYNASEDIKILNLSVVEPGFSFKAGQWVDFYVSGMTQISGYSMTSAPHEVEERGTFSLAVKHSNFGPTNWIHTQCEEGSSITVKVGGDFYYEPQLNSEDAKADLLLIGGGVGINPLLSILSHYCRIHREPSSTCGKAHLMYSAKTMKDLIFKENIASLEKSHSQVSCEYFLTKESKLDTITKSHRIREEDIKICLDNLQKNNLLCYICGPSVMIDSMERTLLKLGVHEKCIKYEKWW